jgi:hypothetical protein
VRCSAELSLTLGGVQTGIAVMLLGYPDPPPPPPGGGTRAAEPVRVREG